jgi:antitoxin (DNA-binding transcriptional repressor) of toxin-antitoxin stability system
MASVSIQEAQTNLRELIHQLEPGEELVITENDQPVAKLIAARPPVRQRPEPGRCKGMITIVSDDDEHLKDFEEYM